MRLRIATAFLTCLLICASALAETEFQTEVQQRLAGELKGHVVTLRIPAKGQILRFDREGRLVKGGPEGPWTLYSRVEVQRVDLKAGMLRIEGIRLYIAYLDSKEKITQIRSSDRVQIEIDTGAEELDSRTAEAALALAFLTNDELSPGDLSEQLAWHFSRKPNETELASTEPPGNDSPDHPRARTESRSKSSPPQCISCPDPVFTDEARRSRHEGVVILWCIVNTEGKTESIRVEKPLGMGLDEEAVKAVQKWRFRPALRDGQPVTTYLRIEIKFYRYK